LPAFAAVTPEMIAKLPRSRGTICPSLYRKRGPQNQKRAQGMPGEGLTHGPPAKK
jgi:hypothetical protein